MRLRSLRIAARASVASGLIASLLATNFGSARAYERLPVVIQTAPLPHTTLPAPPLSPQAERIRLEQLARTIGPPKRSSLPRVTTGLRRASTTGQVRVLDSSSSLSPSAASASDLLQYIAQSQALTQPRTYSGILGRPPGMSAPPGSSKHVLGCRHTVDVDPLRNLSDPAHGAEDAGDSAQRGHAAPKPDFERGADGGRRRKRAVHSASTTGGATKRAPFQASAATWSTLGASRTSSFSKTTWTCRTRGADLAFRRTYNSYSQHDYLGTDGSQISNYGDGWTNTFDAHIAYNAGNSYGQGVSVFDIDGARYDYLPSSQTASTGYYAPPPGMGGSTVYKNGNEFFCWVKRSGTQYCFYRPDMSAIVSGMDGFDGRVLWIYGRNVRNYLTFAYYFDASPDTSQNLNKIIATTEAGQSATLLFSNIKVSSGNRRLLTSLARPDGTAITYGYDSSGDLAYVSEPANSVSTPHCTCLESSYLYFSNHLLQQVFGPRNLESGDYASRKHRVRLERRRGCEHALDFRSWRRRDREPDDPGRLFNRPDPAGL